MGLAPSLNCPVEHSTQGASPWPVVKDPQGQRVQEEEAAVEVRPSAHAVHENDPAAE